MCLLIGYTLCVDISGAGLCVASEEEEVKNQRVRLPLLLLFLSSQQQDEQRGRDRVAAYWEAYVLLSALPGNLEKLLRNKRSHWATSHWQTVGLAHCDPSFCPRRRSVEQACALTFQIWQSVQQDTPSFISFLLDPSELWNLKRGPFQIQIALHQKWTTMQLNITLKP